MSTAASPNHKKLKLETLETNDKANGMEDDRGAVQSSSSNLLLDNKKKVYLMGPMENPEDERRRRNAVTAWRNRVQKRKQTEELQARVSTLEKTQKGLCDVTQRMEEDLRTHQEELRHQHNTIKELEADKYSLETLIQAQQERLNLIREHLSLIRSCSDENDPIRRFLTVVLNRMTSSSLSSFAFTSQAPSTSSPPLTTSSHHFSLSSKVSPVHSTSSCHLSPPLTTTPPLTTFPHRLTSPPNISPVHGTSPCRISPHVTTSPPLAAMPPPASIPRPSSAL